MNMDLRILEILGGLDKITEVTAIPDGAVPIDGTAQGELPLELRPLYQLASDLIDVASTTLDTFKAHYDGQSEPNVEELKQYEHARQIADLASKVFWYEVREHFGLFGPNTLVGIVENWTVYSRCGCPGCKARREGLNPIDLPGISPIMAMLFGGVDPHAAVFIGSDQIQDGTFDEREFDMAPEAAAEPAAE